MSRILALLVRADIAAAVLGGVAIFFAAFSLFHGPPTTAGGAAFVLTAPLAAAVILFAQLAMWFELIRHGVVRILYVLSALTFAIGGVVFPRSVPASWVLVAYWLPAVLTIAGALAIEWAHVRINREARVGVTGRSPREPLR